MNNSFRILLVSTVLLFTGAAAFSQNISQPYSIIGIGDLENSYYNRTSGMGNTGYAMRSGKAINMSNPASYDSLFNQNFIFELATLAKTVSYKGNNVPDGGNSNGDFSIKRLSAGLKMHERWGTVVSLSPFSSVNYLVSGTKDVIGGGTTTSIIDGNGGINQIMIGNSFKVIKNHLSIGVNSAYLFGSVKQTENLYDAYSQTTIASTLNSYYRKFNFTYGLQFMDTLSRKKKLEYAIGLIYSPKNKLRGETSKSALGNGSEIIKDELIDDRDFTLPATYGIGVSVTKNKSLTFAADFKYQDWDAVKYSKENVSLVNSQRISAGVDYSKLKETRYQIYEAYSFQAGAFYNNSQLRMNGQQLQEYGFTLGAGKPMAQGRIDINTILEIGRRGTTKMNLIRENYVQLILVLSYRDFWRTKGRKYD